MRKLLNLSLLISMVIFALLASGCSRARPEENEVKSRATVLSPSTADGAPTVISVDAAIATPSATLTPIPIGGGNAPAIPATATQIITTGGDENASASGGQIVLPTITPIQLATPISSADNSSSGGEVIHIVQAGENLFRIGLKYDVAPETIAAYNGISDVTLIYIGQKLRIPTASSGNFINGDTYIVQNGDSLLSIAVAFGTTTEALISANNLSNPDVLYVGQTLKVP